MNRIPLLGAVLAAFLASASPAAAATSTVQGTIVKVDAAHGTLQIHHRPFPAMPMAMTMVVTLKHRSDAGVLHAGDPFVAQIDTTTDPWTVVSIHVKKPVPK